jgi:hypothetical protein
MFKTDLMESGVKYREVLGAKKHCVESDGRRTIVV